MPDAEPHQIDSNKHSISDSIEIWKKELEKSQLANNSLTLSNSTSQSAETSLILETHKIIPADVSSMVPFGSVNSKLYL